MAEIETQAVQSRTEVAEYLRTLADQLEGDDEVHLELGGRSRYTRQSHSFSNWRASRTRAVRPGRRASRSNSCGGPTPTPTRPGPVLTEPVYCPVLGLCTRRTVSRAGRQDTVERQSRWRHRPLLTPEQSSLPVFISVDVVTRMTGESPVDGAAGLRGDQAPLAIGTRGVTRRFGDRMAVDDPDRSMSTRQGTRRCRT